MTAPRIVAQRLPADAPELVAIADTLTQLARSQHVQTQDELIVFCSSVIALAAHKVARLTGPAAAARMLQAYADECQVQAEFAAAARHAGHTDPATQAPGGGVH